MSRGVSIYRRAHFQEAVGRHLPANLPTLPKLLNPHLKQRLATKRPAGIEHRRRAPGARVLLLDPVEGGFNALLAGDIRADADGLAAGAVDLGHEGLVVGGRAGEERDRVGLCEAAGDSGAGAGADAGDDGDRGGGHCCFLVV